MPLVYAYPVLGARYGRDYFLEPRHDMWQEGYRHVDGVENLPEHGLA